MSSLSFSTKAGTLAQLYGRLESARIVPLVYFTVGDWQRDRSTCMDRVRAELGFGRRIVRSSCRREDGISGSNAGAYLSLPNVMDDGLADAVERVILAYGNADEVDEVLVQPMLQGVRRSGVVFSHDPNTCAPYRIVNWGEGSDTSVITSGGGGRVWQQAACSPVLPPAEVRSILALVDELLDLFSDAPLDCEFAVTADECGGEVLWLLQVRPLVLSCAPEEKHTQAERLRRIHDKVAGGMRPHPFLIGGRTAYGVMPDWNPAEMIGVRPKPLALSLYRELVTDSIWAYQRHNYGYRNLRSFPLMPHFFGVPYIDVRLSFNSFIPADLPYGLAGRLVDYYIERLLAEPSLHDKVEFEIVFSCYSLDLPERLRKLDKIGFSLEEIEEIAASLRQLTNRVIHPKNGLWTSDAEKIKVLISRRETLIASGAPPLERIYWLLEDGKRYGTLPFAGLARAGFISIQMLRSLVEVGVFSVADHDAFLRGVTTVSGQLARDRALLDRSSFLARYGHLRPGTYDILSHRYDEAPESYFDWSLKAPLPEPVVPFSMTLQQMKELARLLEKHGLHTDPVGLLDFMQSGIEQREQSKFHFTRNVSDILALLVEYGDQWGFSRDDMAYCDIGVFKDLYSVAADHRDVIARSIEQGRARYDETRLVSLPPLIADPNDIWGFELPETAPNFITQKEVTAFVAGCEVREGLAGALICIPNADPGYDWLFAYPIAGLITAWGGVNSHMAIRAGELGLPAIIGAGEVLFRRWSSARRLHVDCAGRRVDVLE